MPATEYLSRLIGIDLVNISRKEIDLLEAELFCKVCNHLSFYYAQASGAKNMKFLKEENTMNSDCLIINIMKDIIESEEYDIMGIARYTHTPVDNLIDLYRGQYISPSLHLFRKIIELHKTVRPSLYQTILKKILTVNTNSEIMEA